MPHSQITFILHFLKSLLHLLLNCTLARAKVQINYIYISAVLSKYYLFPIELKINDLLKVVITGLIGQ